MPEGFRLPQPDEHTFTIGQNGSGKTQNAAWILSESDYDRRPHFVLDFKRDELLNKIPFAHFLTTKDKPPSKPGVYITHSDLNDPYLERFFERVRANGNTHVHIDETYMVPARSPAFNAILTQGRSLRVSMNMLSQRPSMCSRFIPSEAKNLCIFFMNDERDRKTVRGFIPSDKADLEKPLLRFHAHWFNSPRQFYTLLRPAPDAGNILDRFYERLKPKRRFL